MAEHQDDLEALEDIDNLDQIKEGQSGTGELTSTGTPNPQEPRIHRA